MKPLAGLKVLELARILAGPWCGQLLADLGAEVIKVERSGAGDDTRQWGPPFVTDTCGNAWGAAYFHSCNRGKSSVAIDIDTEDGQAAVRALAAEADVVIENFKVGGLAKYGLDYSSLKRINQRLIYASITGFGQDGPYAARAGYDYIIQGMSGLMDITGAPDAEPQKVGVAIVDIFTGLYTATAILAAIRGRDLSGEGCHIDMSLLDSATAILANQGMNYLVSGVSPTRLGNAHPNIAPYQVFEVADGHVIIAVGNDSQFRKFCEAIGANHLLADDLYQSNKNRVAHRDSLQTALQPSLKTFTRTQLLAALEAAGVPAGPINRIEDVFNDPQIVHRGMKLDLEAADGSPVSGIASPIVINGVRMAAESPSPRLGSGQPTWKSSQ
ncbi:MULTISPECIES: CaiB/BaiF CoA-transferase family protein [Asticcacaulis]|uniref:CaiB/BaiF CoA transferase family protein n=1 Tax=Asticcacaulis TaxID=76890 RepID=UPI001AE6C3EF|nr:CaiB/BaiF CoA-transferase family protein [Asticcacaulis sp. BE141]MBP2161448.1 crotonobetainyl-CoA:carnitine CoA-transferase CaiB-like acyl-CoA transferase [Asticcacaulis solisilvae]MDR6802493.1 crotonobetainyl-CoA:carnitine CoA-transferase CaiB-like acyl-CoA transferase [Asticcacaulis sp. BE141]